MDKKKHNPNEITDSTLHQLLLDINARLEHIEDMEADNRALIVKVVKQGNSIVDFLKNVEIEDINDTYDNYPNFNLNEPTKLSQNVQDLLSEFLERDKELKELEEELKKHKDKLTPGQVGES